MSFIVVIPARYASTRLPGKMLAPIEGRPLVEYVVERANSSAATRVIVATDDNRIAEALASSQCEVCMTKAEHRSGSDRLAEVVDKLEIADQTIVVNVQGDEPLIPPQLIDQVAAKLASSKHAVMATAAHPISNESDLHDPNVVKVVFDQNGKALYFSRATIPNGTKARAWHHIGIYAYRASFLKRYNQLNESDLEKSESLEQLRVMDNGETIMVEAVEFDAGIGVDTEKDLERVRELLRSAGE